MVIIMLIASMQHFSHKTRLWNLFQLQWKPLPAHKAAATHRYTCDFSPAAAMQFSEIITFPSQGKNCNPVVHWQNFLTEKLLEYDQFSIFLQLLGADRSVLFLVPCLSQHLF